MIHLLACFWQLIGLSLQSSINTGWIVMSVENGYLREDFLRRDIYISSVYWVITTLTTVGYGDFKGYTYQEYLFTMGVEFIGIAFFSFIMGSINKILLTEDEAQDIIDDRLEEVDVWLLHLDNARKNKVIPRYLFERIKKYIESSLLLDYNMLLEGYDFFDQIKPA